MEDIVRQTVFDQCELIIINANSPENEEEVISPYLEEYPNIVYLKLDEDPGLYAVWNIAIKMSRGKYITNANVDDRLSPCCYEKYMDALEENPEIDLVYSDFLMTHKPNETFEKNSAKYEVRRINFSRKHMKDCLPGCNPMWRKTMHEKYGYFDEFFKCAGDWEMWCRAVSGGAIFLRIPEFYCLYYNSPRGLSTGPGQRKWIERDLIIEKYKYLWEE